MNTVVDVLPEDCIQVSMKGDDWGVLYDKAGGGPVFRAGADTVDEVRDDLKRVMVPLYPVGSDTLKCCSEVAKIAEREGRDLLLVFSNDGSRIGCLAH